MKVSNSLENYLDEIVNDKLKIDLAFLDDDSLINTIYEFIRKDIKLFRKKKIIDFYQKLSSIKYLPPIKIEFTTGDFKAYTTDDNSLYISKKYLHSSSRSNLIITLIHESAHLYLSNQENYDKLLVLDKEYFKKYPKDSETVLTSPVEYYADFLMNKIFLKVLLFLKGKIKDNLSKTLAKRKNHLEEIINKRIGV